MTTKWTVLGLALVLFAAGCTASNPLYDGGETVEDDDAGTDGIVPDDGRDGRDAADDGRDVPPETDVPVETVDGEDVPGDVPADVPTDVPTDTAEAGVCGDGTLDPGEACDNGGANSDTTPDACRTDCTLAGCGDGVVDTGEVCDNGPSNSDTAPDACRTTCVAAACGDGVTDTGEACDNGAANSDTAPDACRTTCVVARCGDGVTDTGEACDDGVSNSDTTPDACRTTCAAASCGDGVIDTAEECDDASTLCVTCALTTPVGWTRCTDASGNVAFYQLDTWGGSHSALQYRDRCRTRVEALGPAGYAYYGLGVFYDQNLWDCVRPLLAGGTQYYLGLMQDPAAADFAEPGGGWYWVGYDGTAWVDEVAYDAANTYLNEAFDDAGGGGDVECTRLQGGAGGWTASDTACSTGNNWSGICMLLY